jgi:hypothetical protein
MCHREAALWSLCHNIFWNAKPNLLAHSHAVLAVTDLGEVQLFGLDCRQRAAIAKPISIVEVSRELREVVEDQDIRSSFLPQASPRRQVLNEGPLRSKANRLAPIQERRTTGPTFTQRLESDYGPSNKRRSQSTCDARLWVTKTSKSHPQTPYVLSPGVPPAGAESRGRALHAKAPVHDKKSRAQGSEYLVSTDKPVEELAKTRSGSVWMGSLPVALKQIIHNGPLVGE